MFVSLFLKQPTVPTNKMETVLPHRFSPLAHPSPLSSLSLLCCRDGAAHNSSSLDSAESHSVSQSVSDSSLVRLPFDDGVRSRPRPRPRPPAPASSDHRALATTSVSSEAQREWEWRCEGGEREGEREREREREANERR